MHILFRPNRCAPNPAGTLQCLPRTVTGRTKAPNGSLAKCRQEGSSSFGSSCAPLGGSGSFLREQNLIPALFIMVLASESLPSPPTPAPAVNATRKFIRGFARVLALALSSLAGGGLVRRQDAALPHSTLFEHSMPTRGLGEVEAAEGSPASGAARSGGG